LIFNRATEGTETFTVEVRPEYAGGALGEVLATTTVTILDRPPEGPNRPPVARTDSGRIAAGQAQEFPV
jgi:hypothetical protein